MSLSAMSSSTMPHSNGQGPGNPAISVVVPVRNEAGNVAPLVAEIAAALQGRAFDSHGTRNAAQRHAG